MNEIKLSLVKLANLLDEKGLHEDADTIDSFFLEFSHLSKKAATQATMSFPSIWYEKGVWGRYPDRGWILHHNNKEIELGQGTYEGGHLHGDLVAAATKAGFSHLLGLG